MGGIKDVADYAGVSMMTVSRVVNNRPGVSDKMRNRVLQAVEELDYCPNLVARSMVTKSTGTIAVLYSNIYNEIYADQLMGIESVARAFGYTILIVNISDYHSTVNGLTTLIGKQVDGIIVLPIEFLGLDNYSLSASAYQQLMDTFSYLENYFETHNQPCVVIDNSFGKDIVPRVLFDYRNGTRIAMNFLISCGFSEIACLTSFWEEGIWKVRSQEYMTIMHAHGWDRHIRVEYGDNTVEGGYACLMALYKSGNLPQAVYCGSDYIAVGAVRAAQELGIDVPGRLAIIGHDGLRLGNMINPPLTTVELNGFESGQKAMRILLAQLKGEQVPAKDAYISQSLLVRKTTPALQGHDVD